MNIANWLAATARLSPDAPALLTGTQLDADYTAFARRAAALARHLRDERGCRPGDRVGLFMENSTRYLECLYGIWWAGCAAVPANAKLHAREARWIFEDSGARLVVSAGEHALSIADLPLLRVDEAAYLAAREGAGLAAPQEREEGDLAWIFYTSGTTGRPKGVMLSHGNLVAASLCYPQDVDGVAAQDAALYAAPISHGAGLYNFIHVRAGARHVVPASGGFDAAEVLALARSLRHVSMFAAPTMVKRLVEAAKRTGGNGEGIKTIVYGGGPMYQADILEALQVLGQRFVQIYGQGESPMTITVLGRRFHGDTQHSRFRERLASVGVAHSVVGVRVMGSDGQPLPAGETGEVEVKGATVMAGYWNNPRATAETLQAGWLRTGDVGRLDEDGFLTLSDRSKDVIISGGTNIYPREVEEALLTHPSVREVSVVGAPDPEWGESVVAFVVLQVPVDDAVLDAHCLDAIARFKRPKRYVRLQELPKNNYGKVLKTVLRERL